MKILTVLALFLLTQNSFAQSLNDARTVPPSSVVCTIITGAQINLNGIAGYYASVSTTFQMVSAFPYEGKMETPEFIKNYHLALTKSRVLANRLQKAGVCAIVVDNSTVDGN
jgi:hypothetical protein